MTPPDWESGPPLATRRPNGRILLAVLTVLLVALAAWWWAFAGEGQDRVRLAEPTPTDPAGRAP